MTICSFSFLLNPINTLTYLQYRALCCPLTCLHCRGLCGSSSCLHHSTGAFAAPGRVSTILAYMCCMRGTRAADGCVYTRESCTVSTPQQRGLCCTWTCLYNSSQCCSWTYLHYRCLCSSRTSLHTVPEFHLDSSALQSCVLLLDLSVYSSPGRVSTTGAFARPEPVHTTDSYAAPRRVYLTGA
jgi:hypothetical protein